MNSSVDKYNSKFYFSGGIKKDGEFSKTIDVFNYGKNFKINNNESWSQIKMDFESRIFMNFHADKDLLYFIGGFDGNEYSNKINICNVQNNQWKELSINKNLIFRK